MRTILAEISYNSDMYNIDNIDVGVVARDRRTINASISAPTWFLGWEHKVIHVFLYRVYAQSLCGQ